jgi:hypothetical protein
LALSFVDPAFVLFLAPTRHLSITCEPANPSSGVRLSLAHRARPRKNIPRAR